SCRWYSGAAFDVVLDDGYAPRPSLVHDPLELVLSRRQHRVEQRHVPALPAQHGGRDQRGQRRVRFHFPHLLRVMLQVIGVRQQNRRRAHGLRHEARWTVRESPVSCCSSRSAPDRSAAPSSRYPPPSPPSPPSSGGTPAPPP